MKRGDVILAIVPHASGTKPKNRPALVVQADYYNQRISNLLVATITSNLSRQADAAHLLIDVATKGGAATGLARNSLVSCLNLAVLPPGNTGQKIGVLSSELMLQVDHCLRQALGLS